MGLTFNMGARRTMKGAARGSFELPADDLVTHGVVVGMTGSGKTGLVTVLVEEALRNRIPVLLLDVKGDVANLKLAFPSYAADHIAPWVEAARGDEDGIADGALVDEVAGERRKELMAWGITEDDLASYCATTHVRVITPGSDAGEPLHLLSALERRSSRWDHDVIGARATLEAAVSMVLRLMGRDPDPAQSRAHALLTAIAERRLLANLPADLASLLPDIITPPFATIGALDVETYIGLKARGELAADLNTLIASSSLARWRQGQDLDVANGAGRRQDDGDDHQRRASAGRRARARARRGARGSARVDALAAGHEQAARPHRVRRDLRLPARRTRTTHRRSARWSR
ncbi:MAG: DUF853 family protein [Deltaproteobacteria bacterium]|nr:DUF853 family protein [Deltaproteobacteria bacterium]